MRTHRSFGVIYLVIFAAIVFMYQETPAQAKDKKSRPQAADIQDIGYTVSMPKPWTHLLELEMRVKRQTTGDLQLKMPVWTPGSYLVREYARHVQDFAAKDAAGKALTWQKTNKNTWEIEAGGAKEIIATYRVYANELTVRT